ncbi:MAG: MXAN_5187 C-terminal domain-containing protein, partial [Myxococcota bacterium]
PLPLNRSSNNLLKPLSDDQVTTIATIPPELRDVEPGRVPATGLSPDELPSGDEGDEGGDEDYTLDMPRDELATLFRTLSAESETETKAAAAPSRSPVVEPSYGLDEPLGGSNTSHDAPTQNVFDNISERGWTNIALPALQESANTASQPERPVAPYAARPSGGDPLSPQSLLETLKKRANAPSSRPIRAKTSSSSGRAAVVEESTQVKRVDPADLRRSAEHAIMASRLESNSGIHKLSAVEQQELRELYQKFVDTKKSCGESVEGLTLKRFAKRVIANRRKLIQQYNCRTVRFQVYVKNGKAALKATPLK